MAEKTVKVTLVAVAQPYVQGMKQASDETSKLGRNIDQTGDKTGKFGSKVGAARTALAGLAAAGAAVAATSLVAFLSDAVSAAGDLEQSVGGVNSVFGESADEIHAFGENSAEAVGLSRNSFNELITVTGALLKNKGMEDFAARSLDLVEIGADLSATFGGTAKEAVEALNAAMRGESDPIERYGISLNQTAVNAELAAKGLSGLEGEAKAQAEAQARLDIITRQSADALGAFARETNTLQGQQQRLSAEWEDAKAALGQAFLPMMTNAVSLMREGVEVGLAIAAAFDDIPTPVLAAAGALGAVHILGGPLGRFGGTVSTTMRSAGEALGYARQAAERAGGGFSGAAAGLKTFTGQSSLTSAAMGGLQKAGSGLLGVFGGPWGAAFVGASVVIGKFISDQREAKQQVDELRDSLDQQTGAITDNTRETQIKNLADAGWLDKYAQWGGDVRDVTLALEGDTAARERMNEVTQRVAESEGAWQRSWVDGKYLSRTQQTEEFNYVLEQQVARTDEARESLLLQNEALSMTSDETLEASTNAMALVSGLGDVAAVANDTTPSLEALTAQQDAMAETAEFAAEMHQDLVDSMNALIETAYGAIDADIAYEASLDSLTEAIKENGATHDISTEAGRNNMSALVDVARAARDNAAAQLENGDALSDVTGRMNNARDAFIRGAEQLGYTTSEANALADQLGMTEDSVYGLDQEIRGLEGKEVNVNATGQVDSARQIENLRWQIEALRGKTVTVTTVNHTINRTTGNWAQADGGVMEFYANGGLREHHVAQIAPAGAMRLWAEPETGGEAYIPLAPSKRGRSMAILDEVAARFGARLVQYADGGFSPGQWQPPATPAVTGGASASVADGPVQISGALSLRDGQAYIEGVIAGSPTTVARANAAGAAQLGGRLNA